MKLTRLLYLSIIMFCSSCVSQKFISKEDTKLIPKGSQIIEVKTEKESQDIYKIVYSLLITEGFRIEKENAEMLTIATEGKDLGQSTLGRVYIVIKKENTGSILTLRPEWKPGADAQMMASAISNLNVYTEWTPPKWGDTGRPEFVFSYFVSFAKKISNSISYRQ